jgi:hypothetical protein
MGGLFLFGGLSLGLVLFMPIVLVLGLLVILALRHDDDVDGSRAPAIYASVVAYLGTLTVLLAATAAAAALADVSREDYGAGHDGAANAFALAFIAALVGLGILWVHRSLFDSRHAATGAARRVFRAYVLVLCLTVVVVGAIAGGIALYSLYAFVAPGVTDVGGRGEALRTFAPAAVLLAGCGGLWAWHWRELKVNAAIAP